MASVQTSSYNGRYLKLTVTETATSIPNNTSTVKWTLQSIGGSVNYYTIHNCKVVVNGTTVYNPGTVAYSKHAFPASTGSKSGTITVKHRANGTASPISFALHGKVYNSGDENKTGTLSLSNIPRGFTKTPTVTVNNRTETAISYRWTTSETCKKVVATVIENGTSGWTETVYNNSSGSKSGSFNLTGLFANVKYSVKITCTKKDSGLTANSATASTTTYQYPYITSITPSTCNVGDTVKVNIYNPLSRNVTLTAKGTNTNNENIDYYNNTTTSTSINVTIPSGTIYNNTPTVTSKQLTFTVKYSGNTVNNRNVIYNIPYNNSTKPIFNDFDVYDAYHDIVEGYDELADKLGITDNHIFVQGISSIGGYISPNNIMTPQAGASALSYTLTYLNKHSNGTEWMQNIFIWSNNERDEDGYYIRDSSSETYSNGNVDVTITATDSRGFSTSVTKTVNVIKNEGIKGTLDVYRVNNFESNVKLNLNGSYDLINVNGVNKNYITSIRRRHRESGGEWSQWYTMSSNYPNGTFSRTNYGLTFDNTKAWDIQVEVSDKLIQQIFNVSIGAGIPIFFISSNNKTCYINNKEIHTYNTHDTTNNGIQLKDHNNNNFYPNPYYPIGSIYLSINNTNPSTWFGGTWELISQGRTLVGVDANDTDFNASQKTGGAKTVSLSTDQLPAHTHGSKSLTGGLDFRRYNNGSLDILGTYSTGTTGIFSKSTPKWGGSHSTIDAPGLSKTDNLVDRLNVNATHEHNSVGSGQAHNNMPPYFTCYIWLRTA